jgi:hypothetical protein
MNQVVAQLREERSKVENESKQAGRLFGLKLIRLLPYEDLKKWSVDYKTVREIQAGKSISSLSGPNLLQARSNIEVLNEWVQALKKEDYLEADFQVPPCVVDGPGLSVSEAFIWFEVGLVEITRRTWGKVSAIR